MKLPAHQSGLQLPSLFPRRHFLIHWSQSQFSFTPPFPPFLLFPPSWLTHSLSLHPLFSTASLVLSSVAAARQDTDVRWAFLKDPRSSAPVLSLLSLSPLALLCSHFHNSSLSLSFIVSPPAYCNPLTSHECWRLTASPKSESWNRWNMNGSLVYEKGVWVKEVV